MNDFKLPPSSPKRVIIGVILLVVFVVVVSIIGMTFKNYRGMSLVSERYDTLNTMGFAPSAPPSAKAMYGGASALMERSDSYNFANDLTVSSEAPVMMPIPQQAPPAGTAKIIKNGDISMLVKSIDDTAAVITLLRARLGGEPGNASFTEYAPGMKTGDMTIWIPSARFDEALLEVKKLALRVESENIQVTDVSAQFVDLTARLKNLNSAEAQYVEIMKRAGKISDILEVTRELNNTRSQIESLRGQLDHLSHKVALAQIHITLKEEASPSNAGNDWRPLSVFKSAAMETLNDLTHLANSVIIFMVKLPALLLYLALWVLVLWTLWKIGFVVVKNLHQSISSALGKDKI